MPEQEEELFDHKVEPWTVAQLRKAMDGLPGDLPVTVIIAEEPGSDLAGAEQVVIWAGPWSHADLGPRARAADVRAALDTGEILPDHLEISLEFPPGEYYRKVTR